jgi:nucleoside-diphosphate-sugar epimerase
VPIAAVCSSHTRESDWSYYNAIVSRILITGATGNIGGQVVSQLLAKGVQVRALVRNPSAARLPPQVQVTPGDLTLPETLDHSLDGIDTVFPAWVAGAEAGAANASESATPDPGYVTISRREGPGSY